MFNIIPYAMPPIIIRVFLDSRTAFLTQVVTILICSICLRYPHEFILLQLAAGLVAIFSLRELSQRSQLFRTALLVILTYAALYFAFELITENDLSKLNGSMYSYFIVNGILLLFTYPLLFLLEKTFGFTSKRDSGLWITHYHFGVDYYDRKTKLFTPYSSKNVKGLEGNNWVSKEDGNGNLYIGHHLRGLSIVSLKDRTAKNYQHDPNNPYSIPDNEVRALCIDKNKNVWVGTNNGLALFNPQSEKFITFKHIEGNENSLLSDQILDIKQMKDGTLWICTNMGGVSILNLRENTFISPEKITFSNITVTNDNHGLSGPNARSIIQDSFGNIWIVVQQPVWSFWILSSYAQPYLVIICP